MDRCAPTGKADTPIPVPPGCPSVLLYGGTFDPPTRAHVDLAVRCRDRVFDPDAWVVCVPAARSPFKAASPTPDAHRIAMLRLALAETANAAVWTTETDQVGGGRPSYWVETVRRARAQLSGADLRMLIGADQAVAFHRWRNAREILSIAPVVVALRAPWTEPAPLLQAIGETGAWTESELDVWREAIVDLPVLAGSATDARNLLAQGATREQIGSLLSPEVVEYIDQHGLYAPA